ncbi:MAG: DNA replication/repair protein RecF [Candidatus Dormibacteria bacterium]|jgi:DNA replication and repair protein RecF
MSLADGVAPAARAALTQLRLYDFRNYAEVALELGPRLNIFTGENAQGKTNLLEAVATLVLTRSPRAATQDLIRWGASEAAVDGVIAHHETTEALSLRLHRQVDRPEGGLAALGSQAPTATRVVRTTLLDGTHIAARELLGRSPAVLFWPDDLQLVKAGPEGRRRLLDILLSQLDRRLADDLVRYRRVIEQRNALLRRLRVTGGRRGGDLAAFDDALIQHGTRIQVARAALVEALSPLATVAMTAISDSREQLTLRYLPDGGGGGEDALAVAARLREVLALRSDEELARGVSLVGPHRDDVEYEIDGRPARSTASQGQQRSAVLATKLAEVQLLRRRSARTPILLLDDVLSELDSGRRQRLLDAVDDAGRGPQTLVTCSSDEDLGGRPARHYRVRGGTVVAL